jgi:hypothetical protein
MTDPPPTGANCHGLVPLPRPHVPLPHSLLLGQALQAVAKMPDEKSARRRCQVIDEFIQDLRLGKREIPPGVNVADFILATGVMPAKPMPVAEAARDRRPTLGTL